MGRCYCLPETPDKLWLHVAGHCPAVKSADVTARQGLQRGEGSHQLTLLLSYRPQQESTVILPRATPKPIQFVHASVGEAFPRDVGIHDRLDA